MLEHVSLERVNFWEVFSSLVGRGFPLCHVLDVASQDADKELRDVIQDVKSGFRNGVPFSESMAKHRGVFSEFEITLVRAGEAAGNLDVISGTIAESLADISDQESR